MSSQAEEIKKKFEEIRGSYKDLLFYLQNTITSIVKSKSIAYHEIVGRVKTVDSLKGKLERKDYSSLSEITDLCGIRVITYFNDDVDKIAELIQSEFEVDEVNSVDKRKNEDPKSFGYASLHYIVSLKKGAVPEVLYQAFNDVKFEIQIRTILQHAWAEIEHDLGYKSELSIPDEYRRMFSRTAGLIEQADQNFLELKTVLQGYDDTMKQRFLKGDENIPINNNTMVMFVQNDQSYKDLVQQELNELNIRLDEEMKTDYLSTIVADCKQLNIRSLKDLKTTIESNKEFYIESYRGSNIIGMSIFTPLLTILDVLISNGGKEVKTVDEFIRLERPNVALDL